ncbi:hypothetical protein CVIRNUC_000557 [Coccomyxa viridis]|nr:hypothetical protein CVIRNUC_000557 [Coccomyxa viridis]
MQILIVGILPRGAWSLPDPFAWPNRLTEAINTVNNASQALPKEDPMIHYIDCGPDFINAANHSLNATLLPEYLHPSTAGYRVLADCLKPVVDNLVLGPQPRWNVTAPLMDVRDNYTNTCADYKGAQYTTMSASVSPKLIPKPATQSTSSNSLYSSLDTTTGDR